jgi:hypothetical protein
MPKVPIDFSKTCIYKLVHVDDLNDENIYIGSTTNMINRKCRHHRACYDEKDHEYNSNKYKFIRENGGWDEWRMILIEKYPCNDINEARARERYWIKELKPTLNIRIPNRDCKEWYQDNKEKVLLKTREYHQLNKDYRNKNNLEKYHKNKEEINQKLKEKTNCECGSIFRKADISKHLKTIKHQEWLKNNNLSTN